MNGKKKNKLRKSSWKNPRKREGCRIEKGKEKKEQVESTVLKPKRGEQVLWSGKKQMRHIGSQQFLEGGSGSIAGT
jgi:hypothetical protein